MSTGDADDQRKHNREELSVNPLTYEEAGGNGTRRKPEVEIREMEVDDIAAVFHLGEQVFTADKTPTLYRTWDEFEVISMFNADHEYCLVAELDNSIIGFALGNVVAKKKSAWKYGYLVWLVVAPDFQRLGVASRLFNKFADKMIEDGVRIFLVDTEADNLPALHFFRSRGFGSPQQHIYLTYNPDTNGRHKEKKRTTRSKKNGDYHRRS